MTLIDLYDFPPIFYVKNNPHQLSLDTDWIFKNKYIYIYMKKRRKKSKYDEFIIKSTLNVSVEITFFRALEFVKSVVEIAIDVWWNNNTFHEFKVLKKDIRNVQRRLL